MTGAVRHPAPDDAALVRRVQLQADRQAFALLVRRHQGRVRSLLRRLTGGREAWADELAQETFLQAWRALPGFRGEAGFATWLYRLASNEFLQQQRRGDQRLQARSTPWEDPADDADPSAADAQGVVAQEGLRQDLQRALEGLGEAERLALLLCDVAGCSHAEAAQALGAPLGTVKSQVLRARTKLKQALADWAPPRMESMA